MKEIRSSSPIIYLITDGTLTDPNFQERIGSTLERIISAVEIGIPLIQIREKLLCSKNLFTLAKRAVTIAGGSETRIIINDRADVAAGAGADGVQLAEHSLPAAVIRASFADLIIGVSTHSAESVAAAADADADFAVFGPVFETPGKANLQGLNKLELACKAAAAMPVLAIGGIDETNFRSVLDAGAGGFAAIRFLNDRRNFSKIKEMLESRE